ncbi:putative ras-related protein [Apostichopus japonicus]|uniref:Putative ras-related protein n=1 Tax=Stichopus japonicus TaxID=307972 RepID=A0A2G8KVE2_STIJA|nr:putative ras-related protein [Apostichopus japonicus]
MKEEDIEVAIKVVIVGNGAVGKSSMIQRYCKGIFTKDYKKTIGVDFLERQIKFNDEDVRLMLWDTAGQEEFDAITKSYYRELRLKLSTNGEQKWKKKVGQIPLVLVQNKIDLVEEAVLEPEEAEALAKRLKLRFYRTSVKENLNVEEVFRYLTEKYIERSSAVTDDNATTSAKIGIFNTSTPSSTSPDGNSPNNNENGTTIQLRPNKQRTKGKSQRFKSCVIL